MGYHQYRIYKTGDTFERLCSANYTEASDDLGKADEKMKLKISRRESKETIKWLDLILTYKKADLDNEKIKLIDEAEQIRKILSAIIKKLGG